MSASIETPTLVQPAAEGMTRDKSRVMLAVMLLSVFMAVANIFIVNVATPAIQIGLHASFAGVQFVITGYTLAYAVALIIGGRLGDRYGRRKMLMVGVAGFTIASFLCGIAVDIPMMIATRIAQGLSAALISPQVLSLIQVNYPAAKRGKVFGLYGAAQGLAATTGQVIGGLLLYWNPLQLDWRTVFFFSSLIGLIIMPMVPFIRESKEPARSRLDWPGALLIAASLLMLVYPLVQGQKDGWPAPLIVSLILSIPVLAAFALYENRLLRRGRVPFMNVHLFGQRIFTTGIAVVMILLCSQAAFFLVTAYLLQVGLGFSALKAGSVVLPMGLGYFAASLLSSRVAARVGAHVLTIGSALAVAGYLLLALSVHATGISFAGYEWIPALLVLGVGQGFIAAPITNIVLSKIRGSDIGSASGILTTGMQVAFAVGIGLIGIIWLNALGQHAPAPGSAAYAQSYADAYLLCIYLLAALTALLVPLALLLAATGERRMRRQAAAAEAKA